MFKISKSILNKVGKYLLIAFGIVIIIGAGFYLWQNYVWKIGIDTSCIKIEEHKITGHSMEPLLKAETQVRGLEGYYDCNPIEKGQIAIIKFLTREETFVKKIVGIPGDKLEFTAENQIKLNDEILKNSAGEPYLFSEASQRIIAIPLKDGEISEGRYFVLSEEIGPSAFDSRQYGFVQKEHLKGRVVK